MRIEIRSKDGRKVVGVIDSDSGERLIYDKAGNLITLEELKKLASEVETNDEIKDN